MTRILFICLGNICRSPMAEFVMKDLVEKAGIAEKFEIASAATSAEEVGNPVYPPARKKLADHAISCVGKTARQMTRQDYDTYDYLDKLIGFKLSDIFYAIFYQYYEATSDERALRLAKYFKYGTDKEREIWMLRYGFSFEEIEWVSECVDSIDETEIKFNDKINALDDAQLKSIEQYVHE